MQDGLAAPRRSVSTGGFDVALDIAASRAAAGFWRFGGSRPDKEAFAAGQATHGEGQLHHRQCFPERRQQERGIARHANLAGYPDYDAIALQRFFAAMKALEPAYKQDDEVAYTWPTKGKVAKCSIYLESWEAGAKSGTGAVVGCEANGVSTIAATSTADPKHPVSSSSDPKHLNDVMDLFKRQSERARNNLPKK